jgi:hypothetical protein
MKMEGRMSYEIALLDGMAEITAADWDLSLIHI